MAKELVYGPAERELFAKRPELEAGWPERIQALEEETERYQHTLAQIRKARRRTQLQVAQALGVKQPQVSQLEKQTDLYLSTLENYVHALGGELKLIAVFQGEEFELTLADLAGETETAPEVPVVSAPPYSAEDVRACR
jgi:transcriptional regulator with XRE-family HTH domain